MSARGDWRRATRRVMSVLPAGTALPDDIWRSRHRGISALLWAHVAALPVIGVLRQEPLSHAALGAGIVATLAAAAGLSRLGRGLRSALATLGLLMSAALLVHIFDGLIEAHFHFFVVVVVVSLYQSWRPFLLALAFVLLHHGIGGALAPASVYAHPPAESWRWALVHAGFVLALSIACLACWRAGENSLARERQAREAAHEAHRQLLAAQALAGVGSWEWDVTTGAVTWSDQLYAITGIDADREGPSVELFLALVHQEDRERVTTLLNTALLQQTPLDYECRLVRRDGTVRVVHSLGDCVTDEAGRLIRLFGTCQDITDRKLLHEKIEHLAFHDPLTGLPNRALFLNRLEHLLAAQQRSSRPSAVLFMDLDGFKLINDTLGHVAGDELLVAVADRLRACIRSNDTAARLGGDEFAVLVEGADLPAATEIRKRIQDALAVPVPIQGGNLMVRASIGIALSDGFADPDDILRNADAAMYAAKRAVDDNRLTVPAPAPAPF